MGLLDYHPVIGPFRDANGDGDDDGQPGMEAEPGPGMLEGNGGGEDLYGPDDAPTMSILEKMGLGGSQYACPSCLGDMNPPDHICPSCGYATTGNFE